MSHKTDGRSTPGARELARDAKSPRRARLGLEGLEDRSVPAAAVTIDAADALAFQSNATSTVNISYAAGVYTITDNAEVINVTNNGTGIVTGNGTNTITVTNTTSLDIDAHGTTSSIILNSTGNQPVLLHDTTGGGDFFQIGSGGSAQGVLGPITIGSTTSASTAAVDNQTDPTGRNVTVSSTSVTGLTPSTLDVTNASLANLSLFLGAGADTTTVTGTHSPTTLQGNTLGDTVNVQGTNAGATLTVGGTQGEAINVGNAGSVQGILGTVTISNNNNASTITVDDSADSTGRTVSVGSVTLSGLAPAAINFLGSESTTIKGGTGGNTFTVTGTPGNPSVLFTGTGNDTVNVQATDAGRPLVIHGQAGSDVVNVGSAGNLLSTVSSSVTMDNAAGSIALSINGSGDAGAVTATLTGTQLTGASPGAINFANLSSLAVSLGSGGNTVNVNDTPPSAPTTLNAGTGSDAVTVAATSSSLDIHGQAGADSVTVGNAGSVQNVNGAVTIDNAAFGSTALSIDDSADATARIATLGASGVTGLAPAAVNYSGLSSLAVSGGAGGNNFTVTGTPAATTLNSGAGADTVSVQATSFGNPLTIHGQGGSDAVSVGSAGLLSSIQGAVGIDNAGGSTALAIDDAADAVGQLATVTATQFSGSSSAAITYADLGQLTLSFGSGPDIVGIVATPAPLALFGGGGADSVTITGPSLAGAATLSNATGSIDLVIDNSVDATARAATVTDTQASGFASADVNYANLSSLILLGGTGGDTFTISNAGANAFPTHILGGSGDDTFKLLGVSTLGAGGTLDGGGGVNTLDYTAYAAPASVNLVAGTATGTGGIANIQNVIPSDLTVAVSHGGTFRQGDAADAYTVTVSNIGPGPTTGTVTVTVTLPTGLSPTAADSGTINGWAVSFSGQTITATRSDALAAGASYPALTLTVSVAGNAPTSVTTAATVAGGGEVNTANDSASDPTSISPPLPPLPPLPPPPPPAVPVNAPATGGSGGRITLPGTGGAPGQTVVAFAGFDGEVRVASADITGDGVPDVIVGAGPGAPGGHVKVFDGSTGALLQSFLAFDGFSGGVFVGAGDVSHDGTPDIIVGAGAGAPGGHVEVFDGKTGELIRSFFSFAGYIGGVTVAGGDVNGDGTDDVIVGAASGSAGGHVKAFDGATGAEVRSFFAFPGFGGGVFVGAVDLDGDGTDEILTGAGAGADPHVEAFGAGDQLLLSFLAYGESFRGGVRVAGFTPTGGAPEIVTGSGSGAAGDVRYFDADGNLIRSEAATDADGVGGVYVG